MGSDEISWDFSGFDETDLMSGEKTRIAGASADEIPSAERLFA